MTRSGRLSRPTMIGGAILVVAAVTLGFVALAAGMVGEANGPSPRDVAWAQAQGSETTGGESATTEATGEAIAATASPAQQPAAPADDSIVDMPYSDPLAPLLPYRENPFQVVTEPGGTTTKGPGYAMGERLVRVPHTGLWMPESDAETYQRIKRLSLDYYEAIADANFGARFLWGQNSFPRPHSVMQPKPAEPTPLFVQPASFFGVGVGEVGPVVPGEGPGVEPSGPRPGVGAQPVEQIGPRSQPKTNPSRIRRVAGIVHDGAAVAIVEIESSGTVTRLRVQPGETFSVGDEEFRVRAIAEGEIVLIQTDTGAEVRVPLRGRAANE